MGVNQNIEVDGLNALPRVSHLLTFGKGKYMRAIAGVFTVTLLVISCSPTSTDAPPQAQPIIMMLQAVTGDNPALLESVLSDSQLDDFNAESDREGGLKELKQQMRDYYGTTNLDLKAFRYEYIGNDEAGQVVFTYKGKFRDSIDVVKDGLHWKISGPTKGFN